MSTIEGVVPCTNHGCVFGHPGGMGTNGQCHCLDIRPDENRIRATRNVLALRTALTAERERVARLVGAGELALKYWADRQQRYKNRAPVWVEQMRTALEDK